MRLPLVHVLLHRPHEPVEVRADRLTHKAEALAAESDTGSLEEAQQAKAEAQRALEEARRIRRTAREVIEALKAGPEEDKFAQGMRTSFQEPRGPEEEGT